MTHLAPSAAPNCAAAAPDSPNHMAPATPRKLSARAHRPARGLTRRRKNAAMTGMKTQPDRKP